MKKSHIRKYKNRALFIFIPLLLLMLTARFFVFLNDVKLPDVLIVVTILIWVAVIANLVFIMYLKWWAKK